MRGGDEVQATLSAISVFAFVFKCAGSGGDYGVLYDSISCF